MNNRKTATISKKVTLYPGIPLDNSFLTENVIRLSDQLQAKSEKLYLVRLAPIYTSVKKPFYYPAIFCKGMPVDKLQVPRHLEILLGFKSNTPVEIQLYEQDKKAIDTVNTIEFTIQKILPFNAENQHRFKREQLMTDLRKAFSSYPLCVGQLLFVRLDNMKNVEVIVTRINDDVMSDRETSIPTVYQLTAQSAISLSLASHANNITITDNHNTATSTTSFRSSHVIEDDLPPIMPLESLDPKLTTSEEPVYPTKITLDFQDKGIGGHTEELKKVFESSLYSRFLPQHYAQLYGVSDNVGIILFGPPGTGKTLIARVIGNMFSSKNVKVVNGPELLSRYVGQSTANLREIFADALYDWKTKGKLSPMHVIIFDEFDVICPKRGSRASGTGVEDDMVAQLLTLMDGIDSPKNILIIGLTNRKDSIDPAILRPGRCGIHIEIRLPTEQARVAILAIHTKTMAENNLLQKEVDLSQIATLTENFTGAELAEIVKKAAYRAMGNNFDLSAGKKELMIKESLKSAEQLAKVSQADLMHAFSEITPAFGINKRNFNFNAASFAPYNDQVEQIIAEFKSALQTLKADNKLNQLQFLITGAAGVGKSFLAKYLATLVDAKYIRVLSPESLLGLTAHQQLTLLDEEFNNAQQSLLSVIILDELENLLQADVNFNTYNNTLRIKFEALLKNQRESANKCVVIATAKSLQFVELMQLKELFSVTQRLSNIVLMNTRSAETVKTISLLCKTLGYQLTNVKLEPLTSDLPIIEFSVSELIYKLRNYFSNAGNRQEITIDKIYTFLHKKMGNPFISPAASHRKISETVTTLRQSNSPLLPSYRTLENNSRDQSPIMTRGSRRVD